MVVDHFKLKEYLHDTFTCHLKLSIIRVVNHWLTIFNHHSSAMFQ